MGVTPTSDLDLGAKGICNKRSSLKGGPSSADLVNRNENVFVNLVSHVGQEPAADKEVAMLKGALQKYYRDF